MINVPLGQVVEGHPATILKLSAAALVGVAKAPLASRSGALCTATKFLPQVTKGKICSSMWSQAAWLYGTMVQVEPPNTATGLSASTMLPVRSLLIRQTWVQAAKTMQLKD